MGDVMLYGVLRMPFDMAMSGYLSQRQFYDRVQEAARRLEAAEARLAEIDATPLSSNTAPGELLDMLGRVHPYAMPLEDFKRSEERLERAVDLQQPLPVPDQAAIVWRGDLMSLMAELQHKRSVFDDWKKMRAQQDAAPAKTPEFGGIKTSAPGTPEAPTEDRKGIELWRATLRACGELPEGYEVRIELENGCGMAVWYDAEGERHVIDGDGYLSSDVNEAVDAAIERAAQLDGGQGEGN